MRRLAFLAGLLGIVVLVSLLPRGPLPSPGGSGARIALARPAAATFLDTEAGISAYAKSSTTVDLAAAKKAYAIVEKETADYVLGWVSPGATLPESYNARVYTTRDGWIVAYYPRGEATSKIIDWNTYVGGAFQTYLEEALNKVASGAGMGGSQVSYFHYGMPTADSLLAIVGVGSNKEFTFKVPAGLAVNEMSWSAKVAGSCFFVSQQAVGSGSFGMLTTTVPRDAPVSAKVSCGYGDEKAAIVFVYKQ